jgi:hypothetical protein
MDARPNFTKMDLSIPHTEMIDVPRLTGEADLRKFREAQLTVRNLDIATAELNYLANGGDQKAVTTEITQEQMRQHADQLRTNPEKNVGYTFTLNPVSGKFGPAQDSNEPLPPDVLQQYMGDPVHNRVIERVLYKSDGKGGQIPDKLITWQLIDPEVKQSPEQQAREAVKTIKPSTQYDAAQGYTPPVVAGASKTEHRVM